LSEAIEKREPGSCTMLTLTPSGSGGGGGLGHKRWGQHGFHELVRLILPVQIKSARVGPGQLLVS
jgi:hypothetical protein